MATVREVLILASSYKEGGICLAGKDLLTKEWIRPVSNTHGGCMPNSYSSINPLDIVSLSLCQNVPLKEQPENKLVQNINYSKSISSKKVSILDRLLDHPDNLWSYGDRIDRVSSSDVLSNLVNHQSLYLIKVNRLTIKVQSNYNGNKKLVGEFYYNSRQYKFSITDRNYCQYKKEAIGFTKVETNKYLCISLGALFTATGHHYKLIAAII